MKEKKKPETKEYTALKKLCDFDGKQVDKGGKLTLTSKQAAHFKKNKAI